MCYFITVGVREEKATLLEEAIPRGLAACCTDNPFVLDLLGPRYRTYLITSGGCSCDLFRPSSHEEAPGQQILQRRRRIEARGRKQGWSKARVQRAVREASRHRRPRDGDFVGLRPDLRKLLTDLAEVAGRLAILVHFYDGDIEAARFTIRKRLALTPSMLRSGDPAVEEDALVHVGPHSPA